MDSSAPVGLLWFRQRKDICSQCLRTDWLGLCNRGSVSIKRLIRVEESLSFRRNHQTAISVLISLFIHTFFNKYTTYIWDMFTRAVSLCLTMQYSWFVSHSVFVCVICVIGSVGCIELHVTPSSHEKSPTMSAFVWQQQTEILFLNVSHVHFPLWVAPNYVIYK